MTRDGEKRLLLRYMARADADHVGKLCDDDPSLSYWDEIEETEVAWKDTPANRKRAVGVVQKRDAHGGGAVYAEVYETYPDEPRLGEWHTIEVNHVDCGDGYEPYRY